MEKNLNRIDCSTWVNGYTIVLVYWKENFIEKYFSSLFYFDFLLPPKHLCNSIYIDSVTDHSACNGGNVLLFFLVNRKDIYVFIQYITKYYIANINTTKCDRKFEGGFSGFGVHKDDYDDDDVFDECFVSKNSTLMHAF